MYRFRQWPSVKDLSAMMPELEHGAIIKPGHMMVASSIAEDRI